MNSAIIFFFILGMGFGFILGWTWVGKVKDE
jgi:hypothetical protein